MNIKMNTNTIYRIIVMLFVPLISAALLFTSCGKECPECETIYQTRTDTVHNHITLPGETTYNPKDSLVNRTDTVDKNGGTIQETDTISKTDSIAKPWNGDDPCASYITDMGNAQKALELNRGTLLQSIRICYNQWDFLHMDRNRWNLVYRLARDDRMLGDTPEDSLVAYYYFFTQYDEYRIVNTLKHNNPMCAAYIDLYISAYNRRIVLLDAFMAAQDNWFDCMNSNANGSAGAPAAAKTSDTKWLNPRLKKIADGKPSPKEIERAYAILKYSGKGRR